MSSVCEERVARSVALEKAYVHDVYEQFSDGPRSRPWPKVNQFLADLEPGSLVCDVGCGNGKYLGSNPSVFNIGADKCIRLTKVAKEKENEVIVCDNLALPFRDESFDAVLSVAVVHHFATTERRVCALRELARILRIGGRLIISVWAMEQTHRKFESQDVLVPWHRPQTLSTPSLELTSTTNTSEEDVLPPYHAYTQTSDSDSNKSIRTKVGLRKRGRTRHKGRSIDPGRSSSPSSSSLSSPNETCYSFVRRAIQKLAGSKRSGTYHRPWFLDTWNSCTKEPSHKQYDPDGCENYDCGNVQDLPIELRRVDDDEPPQRRQTFPSSQIIIGSELYGGGVKSKSLTDIKTFEDRLIVRSQSSVPSLQQDISQEEKNSPVESKTVSNRSHNKPKLVKQKQSICDEDADEALDKPTDMRNLVNALPDFRVFHGNHRHRGSVFKQRSMNEELMSTERLREKERVKRNIQKQASLNEDLMYRRHTLDSLRDSFFSVSTSKRFQLIKSGFTNTIKNSTTNIEKVAGSSLKNGFVRMFQNWKANEIIVSPTQNDPNVDQTTNTTFKQTVTNTEEKKEATSPGERRHSKEDGSDSSKDSSLQSDTSVDSEDSFASVIFIPKTDPLSPTQLSPDPTSPRLKQTSVPNSPRTKQSSCPTSPRIKQMPLTVYPLTKQLSSPKPSTNTATSKPIIPAEKARDQLEKDQDAKTNCIDNPIANPTANPTDNPTENPINNPTDNPTDNLTVDPINNPTNISTANPTAKPTANPTNNLIVNPTHNPTDNPTVNPNNNPIVYPIQNPITNPTDNPTANPTNNPIANSPANLIANPTNNPVVNPTTKTSLKSPENIISKPKIKEPPANVKNESRAQKYSVVMIPRYKKPPHQPKKKILDIEDCKVEDKKRSERLRQIRELLNQRPGFGIRSSRSAFPIVRHASVRTGGRLEAIARPLPRLLSLELFNPETDDKDSDSSGVSSPDSVDSVINIEVGDIGNGLKTEIILGERKISPTKFAFPPIEEIPPTVPVVENLLQPEEKLQKLSPTSMSLLEAAADVANSLDEAVDAVIQSSPRAKRKQLPVETKEVKSVIERFSNDARSPADCTSHPIESTWDEECHKHLTDFADKLSEKLLLEIDQYQEQSRKQEQKEVKFQHLQHIDDPYIHRLSEELKDLNKLSAEIQKQNQYLAQLSKLEFAKPECMKCKTKQCKCSERIYDSDKKSDKVPYFIKKDIAENKSDMNLNSVVEQGNLPTLVEAEPNPVLRNLQGRLSRESSDASARLGAQHSIESTDTADMSSDSLKDTCSMSRYSDGGSTASLASCTDWRNNSNKNTSARCPGLSECRSVSHEKQSNESEQMLPGGTHYESLNASLSDTSQDSLPSDNIGGSITYHRYYHVFREGELDQLIERYVENLHIISSYYDHASWCVVAEKVQVWTI